MDPIKVLQETTEPIARSIYTANAPDTSQITAVIENQIVIFTVGGMALNVPLDNLASLQALVNMVKAENPALPVVVIPTVESIVVGSPPLNAP